MIVDSKSESSSARRWFAHGACQMLWLALAYFVVGRLSILLAIPPGYAAPIWPSAGIALIGMLHGQPRYVFIGIWLGSFAVNASESWFQVGSLDDFMAGLTMPVFMGLGAAMTALAGRQLIRRFIGFPHDLDDVRAVTTFLLLGGPLACLISATIGIGMLVLHGVIPLANAPFSWLTWWTGDSLGVLLFSCMLLPFFIKQDVWLRRRRSLPAMLMVISLLMTVLYVQFSKVEVNAQQDSFSEQVKILQSRLQVTMQEQHAALLGMAGLFSGQRNISRDEFRRFAEALHATHPNLQAVGWSPVVSDAQRAESAAAARTDGLADYVLWERDERGELRIAAKREHYMPVYYVNPVIGNEMALGFDLLSDASRAHTIRRALRTGKATATPPITLVQDTAEQLAVIVFVPVYSRESEQSRELGVVSGVYRIEDWASNTLRGLSRMRNVALSINAQPGGRVPLFGETAKDGLFTVELPLKVADQQWWLRAVADQDYEAATRSYLPWSLLSAGLLFAALLGAFMLTSSGETWRTKKTNRRLRDALEELKLTQSELVETQRLLSLGTMVSGLAHELNTPLGIAITAASALPAEVAETAAALDDARLSQEQLEQNLARWQEMSSLAVSNLGRASELVKTFKSVVADRGVHDIRSVRLDELIKETIANLEVLHHTADAPITVAFDLTPVTVETVPGSIVQILTNLYNNAKQHAFGGGAGHIRIALRSADDGVTLCFEDNGKGIPKASLGKVFEPFFTTRRNQGGTGLGLHILHNLIRTQLGGHIRVSSVEGHGSLFEITLPLTVPRI